MNARTLLAIVVSVAAAPAAAGPTWASRKLNEVRALDADFKVVRVITDRAELDAFATWFQRAHEVDRTSSLHAFTHKLDIDAPGGGRWLYDAASGEFTVLSKKRAPVYRLKPADQARLVALLVTSTTR